MAKHYPHPRHDRIIEPFAGAGAYSLLHWRKDVLLVDKYPVIIRLWQWLQKQEPETILGLPRLKEGDRVSELNVCDDAKLLLGFYAHEGMESPRDRASSRHTKRPNDVNYNLHRIAHNLHRIRHWQIVCDDYRNISNQEATWFIDPPYQHGGEHYVHNNKGWDYQELAAWCQSRQGQVIVCENTRGNWLSFTPIKGLQGSKNYTIEALWTNEKNHHYKQAELFIEY